jgi:glycerol transport system ATP-binding protein
VQAGEPSELFLSPAHEFVGHFIGSPGMNVLPAELVDGVVRVGDAALGRASGELPSGPVRVGIRPEFVRIDLGGAAAGPAARVTGVDRMGAYNLVHTQVNGHPVIARTDAAATFDADARLVLRFAEGRAFLFRDAVRCGVLEPLDGRAGA